MKKANNYVVQSIEAAKSFAGIMGVYHSYSEEHPSKIQIMGTDISIKDPSHFLAWKKGKGL